MTAEFSTQKAKSQELSKGSHRANGHFYWLVVSALLMGTPIIVLLYLPLALPESLFPKNSTPRRALLSLRKKIFSTLVTCYMSVQKFYKPHYELEELRKLEKNKERFLLVCNHRSHLDVFLFLTQVEGIQVLAKKALFSVPILNWMMILTKQIPAEKGDWKSLQEATQLVQQRLKAGERVLIFPEFKRCEGNFQGVNSYSLLPFKIALEEKIKILPLVVFGTDQVWPKGTLNLNSKPKQRVVALEAIDSNSFQSAQELRDKIYSMTQNKFMELCREV